MRMGPRPDETAGPPFSEGVRGRMAGVPDDIKIIAQFLAVRSGAERPWQEMTREAFSLRQQLKFRGGFRLTPDREPPGF